MKHTPIRTTILICTASAIAACLAPPVLAAPNAVPGVGAIITKKSDNRPIVAHSDGNGDVRIINLSPGDYSVKLFDGTDETMMRVGRDGRMAFATRESINRNGPRKLPVMRRWAEPIRFDVSATGVPGQPDTAGLNTDPAVDAKRKKGLLTARTASAQPHDGMPAVAVILDMKAQFSDTPPTPCAPPPPGMNSTCLGAHPRDHIDVNRSIAREIARIAPSTDLEAATLIVTEREKNGAYKDATDFARRICTATTIDFDDASIRMGDTTIIMQRGGEPKAAGFKCAPQDNMVRLFQSRHAYVGHVTLLR